MANLQEYLNQKYPNKEDKKQVKSIIIGECNPLKEVGGGELDLSTYPNLEQVEIDRSFLKDGMFNSLTKLKLNNNLKLTKLYLRFNFWPINLEINNCPQLERVSFFSCSLSNLDFLNNLNPRKLIELSLTNNDFPAQDLSCFSIFSNLKILNIDNIPIGEWKENLPHNRFYGSLEPLKNLTKLERLSIINTDIDKGLEFLPDSIRDFYCPSQERPKSKVKKNEKR